MRAFDISLRNLQVEFNNFIDKFGKTTKQLLFLIRLFNSSEKNVKVSRSTVSFMQDEEGK